MLVHFSAPPPQGVGESRVDTRDGDNGGRAATGDLSSNPRPVRYHRCCRSARASRSAGSKRAALSTVRGRLPLRVTAALTRPVRLALGVAAAGVATEPLSVGEVTAATSWRTSGPKRPSCLASHTAAAVSQSAARRKRKTESWHARLTADEREAERRARDQLVERWPTA